MKISGKDLFVDTSKTFGRVPHLFRRSEIDLRVIHVVRDVRAVAWSAVKREQAKVESIARYWVRTHTRALHLGARLGERRYLRFRWEDFCAEPNPVLDQLCEFLGVEHVDLCGRVNTDMHHVIGNRIRLQAGTLSIHPDEMWRDLLEPSERASVERCAGALNRSFGYT
jgi:hypothetical protein